MARLPCERTRRRHRMGDIGVPELLIILAIAIILFGPARIGGVGKSLGEAIRSFRQAVRDDDERTPVAEEPAAVAPYTPENQSQLQESTTASESIQPQQLDTVSN